MFKLFWYDMIQHVTSKRWDRLCVAFVLGTMQTDGRTDAGVVTDGAIL